MTSAASYSRRRSRMVGSPAVMEPSIGGAGRVGNRRGTGEGPFPVPPHRTVRAVFPHTALRPSSSGGIHSATISNRPRQSGQVGYLADHAIQTFTVVQHAVAPAFPGCIPGNLVLAPQPQRYLVTHPTVYLVEHPVAVADTEVGAPSHQHRVQRDDEIAELSRTRDGVHHLADTLREVGDGLGAGPHVKAPPPGAEFEAEEGEAIRRRGHPALLGIDRDFKSREFRLQRLPCRRGIVCRAGHHHHVVGIADQSGWADRGAAGIAPEAIDLVQHDVGQNG